MIFFLGDFLLSSFTNISSYLLILSWLPKKGLYFLIEGIVLSIITQNILYLVVLGMMFLVNKFSKIKVRNELSFLYFFTLNYLLFNLLLWVISWGSASSLIFNYFFNLILVSVCYKLSKSYIKLNR